MQVLIHVHTVRLFSVHDRTVLEYVYAFHSYYKPSNRKQFHTHISTRLCRNMTVPSNCVNAVRRVFQRRPILCQGIKLSVLMFLYLARELFHFLADFMVLLRTGEPTIFIQESGSNHFTLLFRKVYTLASSALQLRYYFY
jgi:hypothetical protein